MRNGLCVLVVVLGCGKPTAVAAPAADAASPVSATAAEPSGSAQAAPSGATGGGSPAPVPPPATSETYPFFRKTSLEMDELARLVGDAP